MLAQRGEVRADRLVQGRAERPQQGAAHRRQRRRWWRWRRIGRPPRLGLCSAEQPGSAEQPRPVCLVRFGELVRSGGLPVTGLRVARRRGRTGRGHDVGQHPADLAFGGAVEDGRQRRADRPVDEDPAVGGVEGTGGVDEARHVRVGVVEGVTDRHVGRLERPRERGAGPGGERQAWDRRGIGEVRCAEHEQAPVVDVVHRAAERVGVFGDLAPKDRRRDEHRGRPGGGLLRCGRPGHGAEGGVQGGQHGGVPPQQRRVRLLVRGAHERVQRAQGQPQLAQRGEVAVTGVREAEHGRVDPAGGGPGEHVHAELDVEDGREPRVPGGDRGVGIVGAGVPGAGGQVDLGGDSAHPHGEAGATGHDDRKPHFLGRLVTHGGKGRRAGHRPIRACRGRCGLVELFTASPYLSTGYSWVAWEHRTHE